MDINFSNHARKRMQQRGISELAVKHLILHGKCKYDGHGGKIYFINKRARRLIPSDLSNNKFKGIRKQLNSYVVIAEDTDCVLTVGHRLKRRKN